MASESPDQFAQLLRGVVDDAARRLGKLKKELARDSGMRADRFSHLLNGSRRPARHEVMRLAEGLQLDDATMRLLLAAAGFSAPTTPAAGSHDRTSPGGGDVPIINVSGGSIQEINVSRTPAWQREARIDPERADEILASMPTDNLPGRTPLPHGSRMPLAPNPLFVGRSDELRRFASALQVGGTVAAIGLGGVGKTQLAAELVHRYGRFFAGGVFWLSFANPDEVPLQVAACGAPGAMGLAAGGEGLSLDERVELVMDAWRSELPRLLIFDDCEEEGLLDAWRPPTGASRILVTSRRSDWSPTLGVTSIPVAALPRRGSIELLRRYRPDLAADDPGLNAIASELGDLPLALHLAGRYLHAYRAEMSLDDYLAELAQPAVLEHASMLGGDLDDIPSPTRHVQSVAQTFALGLGRLDREREADRVAIALLARMACLAPGAVVSRELLGKTLEEVFPRRRADGLRRLAALGLVAEDERGVRLHPLLAQFVRRQDLDPEAQLAVDGVLIACGEAARAGHLTGQSLALVIPHILDAAGRTGDELHLAKLANAAGVALRRSGAHAVARPWFEQALELREQALESDDPDIAESLHNLGGLLWAQGELAAARPLLERALAIRELALGSDHPDTGRSLNILGGLLRAQGELTAAWPLLERAAAKRERLLGPDHPDTAQSLNSMGWLLRTQGNFAAARPLLERALDIRERVLGQDHPDTAQSLNDLAVLLWSGGKRDAVRPLLEQALGIREEVLGPDHPDTAQSLNNLGWVLRLQGELPTAQLLLQRALTIRERVLGPDHPDTAQTLHNLGCLHWARGGLEIARGLLERALAIRERTLGRNHPDIADSMACLGELLRAQGEADTPGPLLRRALAIRERALGPDHPDTADSLTCLGRLQREAAAARPLFERALAIRERALGPDHPEVAQSLHHVAGVLHAQGEVAAARPLLERALAIRERALGPDHPDTAKTRNNLGELFQEGHGTADSPSEQEGRR